MVIDTDGLTVWSDGPWNKYDIGKRAYSHQAACYA